MNIRLVSGAAALLSASAWAPAEILRVDASAAPGGDGSSWSLAFNSLTDALASASTGDEVWIAGGTYVPDTPAGRNATFRIPSGVQVFGGFAGTEAALGDRGDPLNPPSILSGLLPTKERVYHVVTIDEASSSTALDGLHIRDGFAEGTSGAGILCTDSNPDFRSLVMTDCVASLTGGAIYANGIFFPDSIEVYDSVFRDNLAGSGGAAVWSEIPIRLERCEIINNDSDVGEAAVRVRASGLTRILDCEFVGNDAGDGFGGAFNALTFGDLNGTLVERCEFRENSAPRAGAIGLTNFGTHTIRGCAFYANVCTGDGAGAINYRCSGFTNRLTVENCLIDGNTTDEGAGAIACDGPGSVRIINSTIVHNTSSDGAGAVGAWDGDNAIDNSILWANDLVGADDQTNSVATDVFGDIEIDRSIVQFLGVGAPPPSGFGAFDADPLFVDLDGPDDMPGTPDDDVRLTPGSPAIDAGDSTVPSSVLHTDIYGAPRYVDDPDTADTGVPDGANAVVDLGAAEYQVAPPECNDADLAEPYGTLDFSDVLAFLTAFASMDPAADLAPEMGVWDFSDVLAFLIAFGGGCP
ncbi:MAG: right-handed parallel beta-helix repeat-containing protein [Phycisphaerales bacterium]